MDRMFILGVTVLACLAYTHGSVDVRATASGPVVQGRTARLSCTVTWESPGSGITGTAGVVQQLRWYKRAKDTYRKELLLEHSPTSGATQAYGSFVRRARLGLDNHGYGKQQPHQLYQQQQPSDRVFVGTGMTVNVLEKEDGRRPRYSHSGQGRQSHTTDVYLSDVRADDEGTYECSVRTTSTGGGVGGGGNGAETVYLSVKVLPLPPVIIRSRDGPLVEGDTVTLTCNSNLGKPAGELRWMRDEGGGGVLSEVGEGSARITLDPQPNGTVLGRSELDVTLTSDLHNTSYICAATEGEGQSNLALRDTKYARMKLKVEYAPKHGRILFDTTRGRYYCTAQGNPAPTYMWMWMRDDGTQTLMSNDRYLDLDGMTKSGFYRFHCLASNVVRSRRQTAVMATKLRVIANNDRENAELEREGSPSRTLPVRPGSSRMPPHPAVRKVPVRSIEVAPDGSRLSPATKHPTHHAVTSADLNVQQLQMSNRRIDQTRARNATRVVPHGSLDAHHVRTSYKVEGQGRLRYMEYVHQDTRRTNSQQTPGATQNAGAIQTSYSPNKQGTTRTQSERIDGRQQGRSPAEQPPDVHTNRKNQPTAVRHGSKGRNGAAGNGGGRIMPEQLDPVERYLEYYESQEQDEDLDVDGNADGDDDYDEDFDVDGDDDDDDYAYEEYFDDDGIDSDTDDQAYDNDHEHVTLVTSSDFRCDRKQDGVYGAGCRAFYRCEAGNTYAVECKTPSVYNKKTGACDSPNAVAPPCGIQRDCKDKGNKKYADIQRGCRYYYTCSHGFFLGHNECNPGLVFNEDIQLCDWPASVQRPCGTVGRKRGRGQRRRGSPNKRARTKLANQG